jgi:hypothetical protein
MAARSRDSGPVMSWWRPLAGATLDQQILAAGSVAGAGGRCWRDGRGACSVSLAVALSAAAVPREAL